MLGFVGCGNMAQAMLKGILAKGLYKADEIIVSRRTKEALDALHEELGVQTTTDNKEVAEKADVLVLAIKPYQFADVIPEIAPVCKENALVISIAAGQTIANIEKLFGKTMKIVRTMPNTPALVLAGATGICFHPSVSKEERETAITIFESFGVVAEVSENMIDTVIGVSGSSPAFVFRFIRDMVAQGVDQGLPESVAADLVIQTVIGSAVMLRESGEPADALIRMVASPNGTTEAGLAALDRSGFDASVKSAIDAAYRRSIELTK